MSFTHELQTFAETLPSRVDRAATVFAAGQGDVLGPVEAQAYGIHQAYGTDSRASWGGYYVPTVGVDEVGADIASYGELARALPGNQVLSLGRTSGTLARTARVSGPRPLIDPRAYGSTNGFGLSLGATAVASQPWYENPVYLGAGAAAVIGAVWFLTRK